VPVGLIEINDDEPNLVELVELVEPTELVEPELVELSVSETVVGTGASLSG
jgi:hypothetical protein